MRYLAVVVCRLPFCGADFRHRPTSASDDTAADAAAKNHFVHDVIMLCGCADHFFHCRCHVLRARAEFAAYTVDIGARPPNRFCCDDGPHQRSRRPPALRSTCCGYRTNDSRTNWPVTSLCTYLRELTSRRSDWSVRVDMCKNVTEICNTCSHCD